MTRHRMLPERLRIEVEQHIASDHTVEFICERLGITAADYWAVRERMDAINDAPCVQPHPRVLSQHVCTGGLDVPVSVDA